MVKGCEGKRCPCRMWVNCRAYIDDKRKEERIKQKGYTPTEWYDVYFKIHDCVSDIVGNG